MPELRISDAPAGAPGGGRRVEVTWRDGSVPRIAVATVDGGAASPDGELVRWYLEDYAEFPADPAPALAASAEALLARDGAELFRRVFSGPDAAGIWDRARDRLDQVRVEVDVDPGAGPGLAWELLRDPDRDAPVALGAGAFVRTHLQAAGHPDLPAASGDRLRVLLVICRPGGADDVPFRSVASRLVRGGAERMDGLDLDVLRPATFARLSRVLRAAKAAGRPYHVVHFDGHGTYLDIAGLEADTGGNGGGADQLSPLRYGLSVAGPVRPGQHGYLLFEAPAGASGPRSGENTQLVDGQTIGRLLTETGVPVLVLNACRSAYTEASARPGEAASAEEAPRSDEVPDAKDLLAGDVHARIRAYGSLAAEVADMGVPGVVAMRYNVYVVTAAQFMADLYAQLLAGQSLGEAATAARRGLAADPNRQIGAMPVALQDWAVPVVYESVPLVVLRPGNRAAPVIRLTSSDAGRTGASGIGPDGLPRPPDAGFFGRDETLLALDRAFDEQRLVLLHAFAGAGKSSTAAEFARWYEVTGGLDDAGHPERGPGPVLWSSFEHHLTAGRAVGMVGDHFAGLLEADGISWAAVTDPGQRRDLVLQVLAQIPVLWVWDNVEPVTGFPAGTASAWTDAEQHELADLLRDLGQRTKCKVLLTSRRDEHGWLGDLPARVRLPSMPMRESLQLATAIAARRGQSIVGTAWRPLLRFAAGNPLTITVVTGQALRENLTTAEQIAAFVRRLEAGEAQPEGGQDAALGRTRSLAASLDYGFELAFTEAERARLAVLHLFRNTVDVAALDLIGNRGILGEDAMPELAELDRDQGIALLDRAADIGLLSPLGNGFYQIHPALPWYFTSLFTTAYGPAGKPSARRAARAYAKMAGTLGEFYSNQSVSGHGDQVIGQLRAEEANLLHGLELARTDGVWDVAIGCMQGLKFLYERTGRAGEWVRLVDDITADVTDHATGGPLPGREDQWDTVAGYRAKLARNARDWPAATALQNALVAQSRDSAAEALETPAASLTSGQRSLLHNYGVRLNSLGNVFSQQGDPACLPHYMESIALAQRLGDHRSEAQRATDLGNAYVEVPGLRNLAQAERWFRHSLSLRPDTDRSGRALNLGSLAAVALERFREARAAGQADQELLLKHMNDALCGFQGSLAMASVDDHDSRGVQEHQIGNVYALAGEIGRALLHYQRAIQHSEAQANIFGAGQTRFNVAILLISDGRIGEALHYARAARDNFRQVGAGAAAEIARAERLVAQLERRSD